MLGDMPKSCNVLDLFGATCEARLRIIAESCGDLGKVVQVLDRMTDED